MIKKSVNVLFVVSSAVGALAVYANPSLIDYGYWAGTAEYSAAFAAASSFVWQFLHYGFFHFLTAAFMLFYFGGPLEREFGTAKYAGFFAFSSFVAMCALLVFEETRGAIGMNAFVLAITAYTAMRMRENRHPEIGGAIMFLAIFAGLDFINGYSFVADVGGIAAGVSYRLLEHILTKVKS